VLVFIQFFIRVCVGDFVEPKPCHDIIRDKILGKAEMEYQRKLAEEQRLVEEAEDRRSGGGGHAKAGAGSEYLESVNDDWGSSPVLDVPARKYDPSNEVTVALYPLSLLCVRLLCVVWTSLTLRM
jgi:hypothetical protein